MQGDSLISLPPASPFSKSCDLPAAASLMATPSLGLWKQPSPDQPEDGPSLKPRLALRSQSANNISLRSDSLSAPLQRLLTFDLPNGSTRQMELDTTVRCLGQME